MMRLRPPLLFLAIGLIALVPRVLDLGGFVIEDEARYWISRTHTFLRALEAGDYPATAITTHPGVTTMWLGSAGLLMRRLAFEWGLLTSTTFATMLAWMRFPVVLVHTLGILLGYVMLRRLLPGSVAALAALLWATDPFIIGYSRVLHVDGLATTFAMLSVLGACCAWYGKGDGWGWLMVSGICGGLAILSKSSALVIPAAIVVVALLADMRTATASSTASPIMHLVETLRHFWRHSLIRLVVWSGILLLTMVVVWPAVWSAPLRVYDLLRIGVEVEGGSPHVQGNFFLGREDPEPGLLFYPVALALRLTPISLAGLLLLIAALIAERQRHSSAVPLLSTPTLPALAAFALIVLLALSLFSKKLNRYLVVAFPAVDVLAAGGIIWACILVPRLIIRDMSDSAIVLQRRFTGALVMLCILGAVINGAWWHPYSIVAFNQLLGGTSAGRQTFLIGSGEGLEQVAAWLNEQPDITGVVVASTMTPPLQPYLRKGAQSMPSRGDQLPDHTGYVVVYVRNVWNKALPPFDQFYPHGQPLHIVRIHGVEYAWIYQVPPPIAHPSKAHFGEAIMFHGYDRDDRLLQGSGTLSLTLQWQATAPIDRDYLMFAHLLDNAGTLMGQIDVPPAGPQAPTSSWTPGRVMTWVHPLPMRNSASACDDKKECSCWLSLGIYAPEDGERLPLDRPPPPGAPDNGPHTLMVPFECPSVGR